MNLTVTSFIFIIQNYVLKYRISLRINTEYSIIAPCYNTNTAVKYIIRTKITTI